MDNISLLDAAKIVLGRTLYHNATVKERRAGLYELPPQDNFKKAITLLRQERKNSRIADDKLMDSIGLAIVPAAVRLVRVWDSSGECWL